MKRRERGGAGPEDVERVPGRHLPAHADHVPGHVPVQSLYTYTCESLYTYACESLYTYTCE